MTYQTLELETTDRVRTIWLNRPDVRNAMNDTLIGELNDALDSAMADAAVRVVMLAGRGKAFCAGADLAWLKSGREMTAQQSADDAGGLARAMQTLYNGRKPTVAKVHGSAFAGAMGLVTACDIAIASEETKFCLSEVKLGLIPAMISPFVTRAIGEHNARRLTLTAEIFDAPFAQRIGLVHESVPNAELDATVQRILDHLRVAAPNALAEGKRLIRDVSGKDIDDALMKETAARIGAIRASDEGQEGITAFFEKRKPSWAES